MRKTNNTKKWQTRQHSMDCKTLFSKCWHVSEFLCKIQIILFDCTACHKLNCCFVCSKQITSTTVFLSGVSCCPCQGNVLMNQTNFSLRCEKTNMHKSVDASHILTNHNQKCILVSQPELWFSLQ